MALEQREIDFEIQYEVGRLAERLRRLMREAADLFTVKEIAWAANLHSQKLTDGLNGSSGHKIALEAVPAVLYLAKRNPSERGYRVAKEIARCVAEILECEVIETEKLTTAQKLARAEDFIKREMSAERAQNAIAEIHGRRAR